MHHPRTSGFLGPESARWQWDLMGAGRESGLPVEAAFHDAKTRSLGYRSDVWISLCATSYVGIVFSYSFLTQSL